jgi:hypothetical protein
VGLLSLVIVIGIIAGLSIGCFETAFCLRRETIEQAYKLRLFSVDTLVALVVSSFLAAGAGIVVNFVFSLGAGHQLFAYAVIASICVGAALLAAVVTAAAAVRHPAAVDL